MWKGDGYCDDENNDEGCDYDGGDCCGDDVNKEWCTKCLCLEGGSEGGLYSFASYNICISFTCLD